MLDGMEDVRAGEVLTIRRRAGDDLVRWAAAESAARLSELGDRWLHVQGVASTAARVSRAFEGEDRAHLVAAAHLHDVGYAPTLRVTGLHQLDGAAHIRSLGEERLARLVAHHSEARFEVELRGWADELGKYPHEASPVSAALIYCDLTTGPTGATMRLKDRVAEVFERYGDDSLVSEALRRSQPFLARAVAATEELLRRHRVRPASPV